MTTNFAEALRALEKVHKQELLDLQKLAAEQAAQIELLRSQCRKLEKEAEDVREKYTKAQDLLAKYKKKFEAWNQKAQQEAPQQFAASEKRSPPVIDTDGVTKKKKLQPNTPPEAITNTSDEKPSPVFGTSASQSFRAADTKAQAKLNFGSAAATSNPASSTSTPATKVITLLESSDDENPNPNAQKALDEEFLDKDASEDDTKRDKQKTNYKYHQTGIRKKKEREALPAYECEQCKKWYDAMNSGPNGQVFDRKAMVEQCSRHRAAHAPPSSPPDFWELSL